MVADKRLEQLYSGKSKTLYRTEDSALLIAEFRDDATAFNAVKHAKFANKGKLNNYFNAHMMKLLKQAGIPTAFVKVISNTESLVKKLNMLPIECVVRGVAAGSLCKRLGIEEGISLNPPIFEFFLKNDALNDPAINESHILTFGWATQAEIDEMKALSLNIFEILRLLFGNAGLILVDFKLEFGVADGKMYLGDELTPDGCRLWDQITRESLDKDIFRKDLGDLIAGYQKVCDRLGIVIP